MGSLQLGFGRITGKDNSRRDVQLSVRFQF
jgi:hypothetical protein